MHVVKGLDIGAFLAAEYKNIKSPPCIGVWLNNAHNHKIGCRYNPVQYNMILQASLQRWIRNISEFKNTSTGIDADASKGKTRPGLFWQPVGLMI